MEERGREHSHPHVLRAAQPQLSRMDNFDNRYRRAIFSTTTRPCAWVPLGPALHLSCQLNRLGLYDSLLFSRAEVSGCGLRLAGRRSDMSRRFEECCGLVHGHDRALLILRRA